MKPTRNEAAANLKSAIRQHRELYPDTGEARVKQRYVRASVDDIEAVIEGCARRLVRGCAHVVAAFDGDRQIRYTYCPNCGGRLPK